MMVSKQPSKPSQANAPQSKKSQLFWFVALWCLGVIVMVSIAAAFRWMAQFAYQ